MALSVANAWADVQSRVSNIGDVDSTQQLHLASIVNREIRQTLADVDPERVISTDTISVVSGTASYALPSDFQDIQPDSCGFFLVDANGNATATRKTRTGYGSRKIGYYISGTNAVLTPDPTASETLTLRYIPTISDFAADTENFAVDERYRNLVRAGLLKEYYWQKGSYKDADYAFWSSEYANRTEEFIDTIRKEPNAFSIPDNSSSY